VELHHQLAEGVEVLTDIVTHGGVRATTGFDRDNPLGRQCLVTNEEFAVLSGEDVVGDHAQVVVVTEQTAQRQQQSGLAAADWTANADREGPLAIVAGDRAMPLMKRARSAGFIVLMGMLVLFGQSSGKVPPFDLGKLGGERSLFVTRPSLGAYTANRAELLACASALFEVLVKGLVKVKPPTVLPLAEVAQAHRQLEARKTTGSTVLLIAAPTAAAPAAGKKKAPAKAKSKGPKKKR
jgi:hypothetical protein